MRPGSIVTVTFEDGTVYQGQLGRCETRPAETMRFEDFGATVMSHVVTRPASLVLELYAKELTSELPLIRRGPVSPKAPIAAPEPEDVPAMWGAYA